MTKVTNLAEAIEKQNREVEEKANEIKKRPDCQDVSTNLVLISIYDEKLDKFSPITCYSSLIEAKMQFKNIVDHSNSMLSHYPENFYMYIVGEFNQDCGCIIETMVCDNHANDVPLKIYEGISERVCCLKDLQSDEANSYYNVLNSVNASLNTMDAKLNQFARLDKEIENKLDLASKRMARIDALMDNNVDLFPIPFDTKKVAKQLNTTVSAITGKEENKSFFSKILK